MDERVPTEGDPVWKDFATTLASFLDEPRSWFALERWAKEQKWSGALLRNCIAWMETRYLVRSLGTGTKVKWILARR